MVITIWGRATPLGRGRTGNADAVEAAAVDSEVASSVTVLLGGPWDLS
jgi:hypothetical protein